MKFIAALLLLVCVGCEAEQSQRQVFAHREEKTTAVVCPECKSLEHVDQFFVQEYRSYQVIDWRCANCGDRVHVKQLRNAEAEQ
jgi:DNA-directed RNA polymerase subunit RPC12/RpoP